MHENDGRSRNVFGRFLRRSPSNNRSQPETLPPPPAYNPGWEPSARTPVSRQGTRSRQALPASPMPPMPPMPVVTPYVTPHPASGPSTLEDPLDMLKEYDTVFLIDDSGSMAGDLWRQACRALKHVAKVAARYDDDGIDVFFMNDTRCGKGLLTTEDITALFMGVKPSGNTPTGRRLDLILREYLARLEEPFIPCPGNTEGVIVKPLNLIVITDGAASDDPKGVLIAAAKRLDRGNYPFSQVGIQFVQIGRDPAATLALRELDDGLAKEHDIRDMVDTVPYLGRELSGELIMNVLLGGINRKLDNRDAGMEEYRVSAGDGAGKRGGC
ncbi:hypothetical protein IAT38_001337 [Cryptococcus sp. DSM 104549]